MGQRILSFDWARTALGPIAQWPTPLRVVLGTILPSGHPAMVCWGPEHICFANDAFGRALGLEQHAVLGALDAQEPFDFWPAIQPTVAQVLAAGEPSSHEQARIPGAHNGRHDQANWTYSCSPIEDDAAAGGIGGVLVLLAHAASQPLGAIHDRWRDLFDQAPGFICVLEGPQHQFAYANQRCGELLSDRHVLGKSVAECLPEVEGQGFIKILNDVFETATPYVSYSTPVTFAVSPDRTDHRYVDVAFQPMLSESGHVTGIFIEGSDATERALVASELEETINGMPDAFATYDADWRFVYGNSAIVSMLHGDATALRGRTLWELFPRVAGSALELEYRRAAGGELREFDVYDAERERRYSVRAYPRARGGIATHFRDVTDRRHMEAALSAAKVGERDRMEELQAVMEFAPVAIWIAHDPACERITGNLQSYSAVNMQPGDNVSASSTGSSPERRPFREYCDGVPCAPEDLPLQKAARTGRSVPSAEISFVFDDGTVRHMAGAAAPLHDADGNVRGAVAAFLDVTAFTETQRRLVRREQELQSLADNTPDILARFDRDGRFRFVNVSIQQLTGVEASAHIGRTPREMSMPPELSDACQAAIERVFVTGQSCEFDGAMNVRHERRHFHVRLVPEFEGQHQVAGVLAIIEDITERRRAEDLLRDEDRRKDEFLATLAHELRNPLAPLRTGLEVLETTGDATVSERVRAMMSRQVNHLVRLIDDLMDSSRLSAGKLTLQLEPLSVQRIVQDAIESAQPLIDKHGHRLTFNGTSPEVVVEADAVRMAQVIGNLLNNAAKYTPDGGEIEVTVTRNDSHAIIFVRDNGIGITPELLPHIFEMFSQANSSLHRSQGGLGIGLALAKTLVELHNGELVAQSEGPNRGSVFTCRLPLPGP